MAISMDYAKIVQRDHLEKRCFMAKDIIHEPVKEAIENSGWTVTHDQYTMIYAEFKVYADLAAERIITEITIPSLLLPKIYTWSDRCH